MLRSGCYIAVPESLSVNQSCKWASVERFVITESRYFLVNANFRNGTFIVWIGCILFLPFEYKIRIPKITEPKIKMKRFIYLHD